MSDLRKILNLVDDVSSVNYGIWHAAVATSGELQKTYGIESWLVSRSFDDSFRPEDFPNLKIRKLTSTDKKAAHLFLSEFNPEDCIIASHGCWQFPTRWGALAKASGFQWVYTPHGMLEPWSMQQKSWKKLPYFYLLEKPLAGKASLVRAVGKPELDNLKKHFPAAVLIPNGIYREFLRTEQPVNFHGHFLFLARLHHKKNVLPLVKAWSDVPDELKKGRKLLIAGTDDGEKENLLQFIRQHPDSGIEFLGPVFGTEKKKRMTESSFYILPSLSEGFPTSVVEAVGAGLIPMISEGCNFPELLELQAGIDTSAEEEGIRSAIINALKMKDDDLHRMIDKARHLVEGRYLWDIIAGQQTEEYGRLLQAQEI